MVNAATNALAIGDYQGTLQFANTTSGTGNTSKSVTLEVGAPKRVHTWNMDAAPSWTAMGSWQEVWTGRRFTPLSPPA